MSLRTTFLAACAVALLHGATADAGTLTVNFDTTPKGGNYAPANIVSVWVQNSSNQFVKTIGRWAGVRKNSLVAWTAASGIGDADAVTGATRGNHNARLTVTWDLKNKAGIEVPDDTYTIRMELADRNSTVNTDNHQASFTFVKGPTASNQTVSGNGFNNVTIAFTPTPTTCNNGRLDAGETCDPPGSCPTSCAVAADACKPNVLTGTASSCTAACVVQSVTACVNGDGCCAPGCTAANDNDCQGDGSGPDGSTLNGGCNTGNPSAGLLLVLLGLGLVVMRRRGA